MPANTNLMTNEKGGGERVFLCEKSKREREKGEFDHRIIFYWNPQGFYLSSCFDRRFVF